MANTLNPNPFEGDGVITHEDLLKFVQDKVLPTLRMTLTSMYQLTETKETQLALMDLEMVERHMDNLQTSGGSTPLKTIPLADSQVLFDTQEEANAAGGI